MSSPTGATGTYSVSLQSLTNVDTPYVYFTFGAPQLGTNQWVFGLPFLSFTSNVTGSPDNGERSDVPWASLSSTVNTNGLTMAPGYAFDVTAGGYVETTFNITTYPGLMAIMDHNFVADRAAITPSIPAWPRRVASTPGRAPSPVTWPLGLPIPPRSSPTAWRWPRRSCSTSRPRRRR